MVQNISKRMKLLRLDKPVVFHNNDSLKIGKIGLVIKTKRVFIKN